MTRTSLLLLLALFLTACGLDTAGPDPEISVEIHNSYAESLFTVAYLTQGRNGDPERGFAFQQERIPSNRTATSKANILALSGEDVVFTFTAVSLGEAREFDPVTVKARNGTYEFDYIYDLATAAFTIEHGWK